MGNYVRDSGLEEIANSGKFIFFDTSIIDDQTPPLLKMIGRSWGYNQVEVSMLANAQSRFSNLGAFIAGRQNVYIPGKAAEESINFLKILEGQKARLDDNLASQHFRPYSRPNGGSPDSMVIFANMVNAYRSLIAIIKNHSIDYGVEVQDFNDLYKAIVGFSKEMHLKDRKRGRQKAVAHVADMCNDEHILATVLYFSLLNRLPVALVAADEDYSWLVRFTYQAIATEGFPDLASHRYFKQVKKAICKYSWQLFILSGGKVNLDFSTEKPPEDITIPLERKEAVKRLAFDFYLRKRGIFEEKDRPI
ncbi:hypothetical protein HYU13_05715 [Candidatus Woesearchaeota archaeon]|nr:hypothetical protein [Candidatus Woesearchaeota archaeon]